MGPYARLVLLCAVALMQCNYNRVALRVNSREFIHALLFLYSEFSVSPRLVTSIDAPLATLNRIVSCQYFRTIDCPRRGAS